jgi:uncharacterized protein (DUF302 family)
MTVPGFVVVESTASFLPTVARLELALTEHAIEPMARIDHGGLAERVGLPLGPMLLLLFGDPCAGTPLMQMAPGVGIDLPLKLLVWEEDGKVRIAYNDPAWIARRHELDSALPVLAAMRRLLHALAAAAAGGA